MYDLKVTGGSIVDGTGAAPFVGDIAIAGGVVVAVKPGGGLDGDAVETIDAAGMVVTPGFVDIHTHYDGQVSWDELLEPSSGHGVTTVVTGNCGVGFAPVRRGSEQWLIGLMEGVEDIPGTALSEGIRWTWETFPQYLDALEDRSLAVDVGTQIAHGAVRAYVMGDRGARNEPATPDEIEAMGAIVREAIEAGALGFSTSRTLGHRAIDGEPVPGTFAAEDELFGLGQAMAAGGRATFELAPAGAAGEDLIAPRTEMDWMCRLADKIANPVSFALLQVNSAPDLWRELMDESLRATERGAWVVPQVAARPFGMMIGLQTHHAFAKRPTYRRLAAELDFPGLVAALGRPEIRRAILDEADEPADPSVLFDAMPQVVQGSLGRLYPLGAPPDYEPTADMAVGARADRLGVAAAEVLYDLLLADEGRALLMLPFFNFANGDHDAIRDMLTHPAGVSGLSDGGAHCRMICDASMPTYLLTHWARDRSRGPRLSLEYVVKKQTRDTAELYGLSDRGELTVGKKGDLNVIDFGRLSLEAPRLSHDLPAGGGRLLQDAHGYLATVVSGQVTRRNGTDTGARPGRLVRGARR